MRNGQVFTPLIILLLVVFTSCAEESRNQDQNTDQTRSQILEKYGEPHRETRAPMFQFNEKLRNRFYADHPTIDPFDRICELYYRTPQGEHTFWLKKSSEGWVVFSDEIIPDT